MTGVKITITLQKQGEPPWKSQELLLWQIYRLRRNPSFSLALESKCPCKGHKTVWWLRAHFISFSFFSLNSHLAFHLAATCARPILHHPEGFRVLCSDAVEKLWRWTGIFLPRFCCCAWVSGWLDGVNSPIDCVSSRVILLYCDTWHCLSLSSTPLSRLYDV